MRRKRLSGGNVFGKVSQAKKKTDKRARSKADKDSRLQVSMQPNMSKMFALSHRGESKGFGAIMLKSALLSSSKI